MPSEITTPAKKLSVDDMSFSPSEIRHAVAAMRVKQAGSLLDAMNSGRASWLAAFIGPGIVDLYLDYIYNYSRELQ